MKLPDIDLDTPTDFDPQAMFSDCIRGSRVQNNTLLPHPCGYYLQNIPQDKITQLSAIPYKDATALGYFKIDFLHVWVYDKIRDRDHFLQLSGQIPDWSMLQKERIVKQLFQLSNHFDIIQLVRPTSITDLSDCLALIRPGKRKLLHKYVNGLVGNDQLYSDSDEYYFKRSHAIAYAQVIVIQLNLIKEGVS